MSRAEELAAIEGERAITRMRLASHGGPFADTDAGFAALHARLAARAAHNGMWIAIRRDAMDGTFSRRSRLY